MRRWSACLRALVLSGGKEGRSLWLLAPSRRWRSVVRGRGGAIAPSSAIAWRVAWRTVRRGVRRADVAGCAWGCTTGWGGGSILGRGGNRCGGLSLGPCGESGQWVMFSAVPRIGAAGCVWSWRVCQRGGPHGGLCVESGLWAASGVARRAGAAAALGLRGGPMWPSASPTEFLRESGVDLTRSRCGFDADPARILRRFGAVSVPCEWRFCERSRGGVVLLIFPVRQ